MAASRLVNKIESAFKSKQYALVIFLDISAAFDSAWYDAILHNLIKLHCLAEYIHFIASFFFFIASFLCNWQVTISVDGELLNKQLNRSCPQSGILSPFLWLILINDLLTITLPNLADIQASADDTALTITGKEIANSLLDVIHKWGLSVKLTFNPTKCEAVIFTRKMNVTPITGLIMNNQKIAIVPEAKYFGIWLDRRLNWHRNANEIVTKSRGLIFPVHRCTKLKWRLSNEFLSILWRQAFEPILLSLWLSYMVSSLAKQRTTY